MKVLMVNTYYYMRGGDCRYVFNASETLRSEGHQVSHFAMHHPLNRESPFSRYFSPHIDFPKEMEKRNAGALLQVLRTIFYNHEAARGISTQIRHVQPHVAHLNNYLHHLGISVLCALRKQSVPIVWTLHDYTAICPNAHFMCRNRVCESCLKMKFFMAPIKRCKKDSFGASFIASIEGYFNRLCGAMRHVDLFVAPSEFLRAKMIQYGIPWRRIVHIPNFIKVSDYRPHYSHRGYFLYMGRLDVHKGIITLLEATALTRQARLVIAGGGPQEKDLQKYAYDKGLRQVEFLGHLSSERLRTVTENALAIVVPSEWYEVFGLVILEAYACGKPVIASRIGGIPELVQDGVTGFLFEPGNVEELSEKMNYLLKHPGEAREMGRRARQLVLKRYNPQVHYDALMQAYARAM